MPRSQGPDQCQLLTNLPMQKLKLPEVEELTPSLSVPILDSGPLLSVKEISFIACDESRLLTGYDRQGVPIDALTMAAAKHDASASIWCVLYT